MPKRLAFSFILLSFFLLLFSCSTEKNRFLNRSYHSVTTKYNGYFNARESYNEALESLKQSHSDNYEEVLDIFRYGSSQDRQAIVSNMDIAYEKCSRVIRKHSMNIKDVEYNRFIDDAYFLIARSHFFKEDYNLAIIMFEYIIRQYDTPLKYESKLWIAKCRHELEQYDKAEEILEIVRKDYEDGLLEDNSIRLYMLVNADHYIRKKEYSKAVGFLEEAVSLTKKSQGKVRLAFILGQVHYRAEDYLSAQKSFAKVLKMNPHFDMAFRARINMAMSYDPRAGNLKQIEAELEKMLEMDRNEKYKDEIYYAMAMLELRQDNKEEAIDFFLKSAEVSEENKFQKGLSYLRLGEMHFEIPDYLNSSIYYDSVISFLPNDYEGFEKIKQRQEVLFELAFHIRVIEREDSLQRLAKMSSNERNKIVDGIISELREEERREKEREMERMRQMQTMGRDAARGSSRQGGGEAGWYFYNSSSVSFGKTEFYTKWGDRPLEDLWRISNKQVMAFGSDFGEDGLPEDTVEVGDVYDRQTYLVNIPLTEEQLKASKLKIAEAYYNKGIILKNKLADYKNSIESFQTLIDRYPDFDQNLNAHYFIYSICLEEGNTSLAEQYRNRIITKYPDSDIAKILKDPNYAENIRNRQNRANLLYNQSYTYFNEGNYDAVISNHKNIDTLEVDKKLAAKFSLLKAIAHGNKEETILMKDELEYILASFPETSSFDIAKNLLEVLNKKDYLAENSAVQEQEGSEVNDISSIYSFNPDAVHFFALVIDTKSINMRDIRSKINTYNRSNYTDENLTISNIFLNETQQLITITNFKGMEKAMEYYAKIFEDNVLEDFDTEEYLAFLISVENYPIFYQNKDVDEYMKFYLNYYFQ